MKLFSGLILVVAIIAVVTVRGGITTARGSNGVASGFESEQQRIPQAHSDAPAASTEDAPEARAQPSNTVRFIPAAEMQPLLRSASASETAILEDGVVTREEFLGAFHAANSCIVEAAELIGGILVHPPVLTGDEPRFGGLSSTNHANFLRAGEAEIRCATEYYDEVVAAWGMSAVYGQRMPLWDRIGECLRAKGYAAAPGLSRVELAMAVGQPGDDISDFHTCEDEVSREWQTGR